MIIIAGVELTLQQLPAAPQIKLLNDELTEALRAEQEARERFRGSLDEDVRAEFINGDVVVQLAARDRHNLAVKNFSKLLDTYAQLKRLGAVRMEQALTAFSRNDYGPDICFWKKTKPKAFTPEQLIYPCRLGEPHL